MNDPTYFQLTNAAIVEVSGRHATRYLNNRLTNDVSRLGPIAAQSGSATVRAGALSAQGKLEGLFTILVTAADPGKFTLVCDAGKDDADFLAALSRYKVADDVQFAIRDDLKLIHTDAGADSDSIVATWDRNRGLKGGRDVLVSVDYLPHGTQLGDATVTKLRLLTGEPQFGIDFESDALLAEIGLVDSISFTKGCYVGQEVVARIDALGKPPRLLLRGSITGAEPLSDYSVTITDPSPGGRKRTIGEITTALSDKDHVLCFAMLRNDEALLKSDQLRVDWRGLTIK